MHDHAIATLPRHRRLLWEGTPEAPAGGPFEPLSERIRRSTAGAQRPGLPLIVAVRIGRDLAEALTCLHLHGFAAGQLDTDCVLVGSTGETVLRPLPAGGPAPDPLNSAGYRDLQQEDLRQLGVMIFELVARRGFTPRDRCYLEQGFPILCLTRSGVPAAVDELVCQLLLTRRGRGYRRVKDVLDRLRQLVDELEHVRDPAPPPRPPPPAVVPPAPGAIAPRTATHRLLGLIAVALGVVLVALELAAAWRSAVQ